MNPFGKHKILSFYAEAREILAGNIPPPRMVSFWPTTVCNFNCSFCLYKEENSKDHVIADAGATVRLIEQLPKFGVKSLELSGGGEPTLHPDLDEIATFADECGLKLGLFTNGMNLDWNIIRRFKYVRIGLDAVDAESYERLKHPRAPGAFDTVRDNVRELVRARGGNKRPRIGIKFLMNSINYLDVYEMVRTAHRIGVDYVQFKREHNGPEVLTPEQTRECQGLIDALKLTSMYNIDVCGSVWSQTDTGKCWLSPTHTVIDPNGDVFVCCFLRDEAHTIGNAFREKFSSFWGGERHKQILDNLDARRCNAVDCRWRGMNKEMREVMVDDAIDIDFI